MVSKSVLTAIMTAGLCAISTVATKLVLQMLDDQLHGHPFTLYVFMLYFFYVFTLWLQLKATAFMFGFFDTTMTIATYGAILVLIPTSYGIILFEEEPVDWSLFLLSNFFTMTCVLLLYREQEKDHHYDRIKTDEDIEDLEQREGDVKKSM